MNNNDILIRLRYALDLKDAEMVEVFGLGGIEVTKVDIQAILSKVKNDDHEVDEEDFRLMTIRKKSRQQYVESFEWFNHIQKRRI